MYYFFIIIIMKITIMIVIILYYCVISVLLVLLLLICNIDHFEVATLKLQLLWWNMWDYVQIQSHDMSLSTCCSAL